MSKENLVTISVKRGNYSVTVKVPEEVFNAKSETIINTLKQCLNSISQETVENVITPQLSNIQNVAPVKNEFKIRERIPNNVVDVKTLDIKQAVTEKALVRCPQCGQAHCLAVNSGSKVYVMEKDFDANDFNIIAEFDSLTSDGFVNMCCKTDTDRLAYFNDLQSVPVINRDDFTVNNDTEVFCPVCCKSDTFLNWKNAYESPLEYFETEHLCDVCGGETVTKMIKKQKVNKCEICKHETKYEES